MNIVSLFATDAEYLSLIHERVIQDLDWENRFWQKSEYFDLLNLKTTKGFKAIIEENIVAFIILQVVKDEAEILYVATDSPHQRSGIAQTLWDHCYKELQNQCVKTILLEVCSLNTPAISFYKKNGFSYLSTRKNYYLGKDNTFYDANTYCLKID